MIELAPSFVKLDSELVHEIDKRPRKRTVVSALVKMCLDLGAQVLLRPAERALRRQIAHGGGVDARDLQADALGRRQIRELFEEATEEQRKDSLE